MKNGAAQHHRKVNRICEDRGKYQPELWKLETEIHRLLNQARGEEAEPLIALLEQRLHEPNRQDKQFIIHTKALALANQKKISLEQERDMCREALYLTLPHKSVNGFWDCSIMQEDMN